MSPFVLCLLAFSAVVWKLRNTVPGCLRSSKQLDLWIWVVWFCAFYCCCVFAVPPRGSYCSVLFTEFVVSGLVFPLTQDLIQEINELRLRVGEMDNERLQYEKKLKTTKVSEAEGEKQRWV